VLVADGCCHPLGAMGASTFSGAGYKYDLGDPSPKIFTKNYPCSEIFILKLPLLRSKFTENVNFGGKNVISCEKN
jgi:hypothetical protein